MSESASCFTISAIVSPQGLKTAASESAVKVSSRSTPVVTFTRVTAVRPCPLLTVCMWTKRVGSGPKPQPATDGSESSSTLPGAVEGKKLVV
jgi:hypothetical protein